MGSHSIVVLNTLTSWRFEALLLLPIFSDLNRALTAWCEAFLSVKLGANNSNTLHFLSGCHLITIKAVKLRNRFTERNKNKIEDYKKRIMS